ncbi:MAG TPA: hypothetical protein V6C52_07135 [Coleofasciculaceae cyanobacterium]|jgi:hypothetical protein
MNLLKQCLLFILILGFFTSCAKGDSSLDNQKLTAVYDPAALAMGKADEVQVLRQIPPKVMQWLAKTGKPDSTGMTGRNKSQGWIHVAFQRTGMRNLLYSIVQEDTVGVRNGWSVIDAAFSRQKEDGSFELGTFKGQTPKYKDNLSGTAFWIAELSYTLLVLEKSNIHGGFDADIEALKPKIKKAAYWLKDGKDALYAMDAHAPNRLFYDALAFGLAGTLVDDPHLRSLSAEFANQGLSLQDASGVFLEKSKKSGKMGFDSSYQAVSVLNLARYTRFFPNPEASRALARGVQWELNRILPSGEITVEGNSRTGQGQEELLGRKKDIDYPAVLLALFYDGFANHDPQSHQGALKVAEFVARKLE